MPITKEQAQGELRKREAATELERRGKSLSDYGLFIRPRKELPGVWKYNKDLAGLLSDEKTLEDVIPLDVKNDFGRVIGMTEKPDETKDKLATSLFYSVQFGQPPKITFNLMEELNKLATGTKQTASSGWGRIKQRYQGGKASVELMDKSFDVLKDTWKNWEAFELAEKDIEKLQGSMPNDIRKEFRKTWEKMVGATAEQLPIMWEAAKESPEGAIVGGMLFGMGSALATLAFPTIGEEAIVPAAIFTGMKLGAGVRGAIRVGQLEAGGMFLELAQTKDKYGNRVDPRIAVVASFAVGAINGGIELAEWQILLSTFGIGQKLFDKSVSKVTHKLFTQGTIKEILARKIAQYGIALSAEVLQEVEQETSNIVFSELAKEINNQRYGTDFKPITAEDLKNRYKEVTLESARAMGLLVAPGTTITGILEMATRKPPTIAKAKPGVEEVKAPEIAEKPPSKPVKAKAPTKPIIPPIKPPTVTKAENYWGRPELKEDYTPKPYVKVTANMVTGKKGDKIIVRKRTFWAEPAELKDNRYIFREVTKEGVKKDTFAIANKEDVIKIQQALNSKKYGELEVIEAQPVAKKAEAVVEELEELTEDEKRVLEAEASQEVEPNLYIGSVTEGMKRRIAEGIGAVAEDIKGFIEGAFPTIRTKIKMTVGEAETYLEWLMNDLKYRLENNFVGTENQLAWANADWGDIVALRETLGMEKIKRPFQVIRAKKNKTRIIKEAKARIWAAIKPGSLQESKMTVGEVLAVTMRKVAKETKMAFVTGRRELRATLRAKARAKKRITKAIDTIQKSIPKSVDFFYREAIEALRSGFDLIHRSKKTIWQMEQTKAFLKQQPEKIKDMPIKLMKRVLQKPLNDLTIEELEEIAREVTKLKQQGKLKRELQLKQEAKELDADIQKMTSNIVEAEGVEAEERPVVLSTTEEGLIDTAVKKTKAWTLRPQRIFDMLDGMKKFAGAIFDFFINKVNEATDARLRMEDKRKAAGLQRLGELGLSLSGLASTRIVDGVTYTINEMIAVYNFNKNHLSRLAIIYGNNISEERIRNIIANLSEAEKAWGDWIVEDFEARYSPLRRAVIEAENRDPGYQENYTPMRRQDVDYKTRTDEIIDAILRREALRKAYAEKGATIQRKDIAPEFQNPIKLDATGTWLDQLHKQEHYIHFAKLLKQMHKVADNKTFKGAVKSKFGKEFNRIIKQYINRVANPNIYKSYNSLENLSRRLRQNTAIAYLAYNLLTMAKQLPSLMLYLPHTGFTHLISSAMDFSAHPIQTIQMVRDLDPQVKHRSVEREFEEMKHQNPRIYNRLLSKFGRAGMEGIFLFDTVARTIGWNAVYQKGLSMNMSEVEAVRNAQNVTLRTQPAAAAKDLAQLYATNEFANWFTMFTNQLNQIYNITTYDIYAAWKNKDYSEAGLTILGESLVALSIWMIAKKDIPDEPKDFVDAVAEQFFSSLPIVGKMLMTGKRGWGSDAPPVFKLPKALGAAFKKLQAGKELSDSEKLAVAEGLAVIFGIPYTGIRRVVETLSEDDIKLIVGKKPK